MTYSIGGFQQEFPLKYSFNLYCNYPLIKIILKLSSTFPYSTNVFRCRVNKLYEFLVVAIPAYCLQNNPPNIWNKLQLIQGYYFWQSVKPEK